ncbi:hypothetical protein KJ567_06795 [Candidatus Bipolaricaulota bacterium]|nr:hypothetical protein [Candidatus Bipolaricaulota bacterium]
MSTSELAARVGLKGRHSVLRILRSGSCSPSTAARIEAATDGAVSAVSLLYANQKKWRLVNAPRGTALLVEPVT